MAPSPAVFRVQSSSFTLTLAVITAQCDASLNIPFYARALGSQLMRMLHLCGKAKSAQIMHRQEVSM